MNAPLFPEEELQVAADAAATELRDRARLEADDVWLRSRTHGDRRLKQVRGPLFEEQLNLLK